MDEVNQVISTFRNCAMCGASFPKFKGQKYCSKECAKIADDIRKEEYKTRERVPRPYIKECSCVVCGKTFYYFRAKKYCSQACENQVINERNREKAKEPKPLQELKCTYCGKTFYAKRKRMYCSDECSYRFRQDEKRATKPAAVERPKRKYKPIKDVELEAREQGMTYGKYNAVEVRVTFPAWVKRSMVHG